MELKKRTGTWALRRMVKNLLPPQPIHYRKTDLTLKILAVIAVYIGGGAWLYKYYQTEPNHRATNLAMQTKVLPYSDKLRLLAVEVKSINPRLSEAERSRQQGDVLNLQFRQFPAAMKQGDVIDADGPKLIQTVSIIPKQIPYDVDPGLRMDNMRVIVVPAHSTILVRAEIDRKPNTADKAPQPDADFVPSYAVVHID